MFSQLLHPCLCHIRYVCGGGTVCPGAVTSSIAVVRCSCPSPAVPCAACRNTSQWERCLSALCSVKGRKKYAHRRVAFTVTYQAAGRHTTGAPWHVPKCPPTRKRRLSLRRTGASRRAGRVKYQSMLMLTTVLLQRNVGVRPSSHVFGPARDRPNSATAATKRSTSPLLLAVKNTELCMLQMLHNFENCLFVRVMAKKASSHFGSQKILHATGQWGTKGERTSHDAPKST